MRRQLQRSGRRLDASAREEVLDPAEPDRLLASRPRRYPATEGRPFEGLRKMAERQASRSERRLEIRPGRPATERREAAPLVELSQPRESI